MIVTDLFVNLLFVILPANSSLDIPLFLIVTIPEVTVKLSLEKEATPLFVDVASSEEIVTVPLDSEISIPSPPVYVIVSPSEMAVVFEPSLIVIAELDNFVFSILPANWVLVIVPVRTSVGSPVQLLKLPEDGVPNTGVTNVLFVNVWDPVSVMTVLSIFIVFPDLSNPVPAVICPAPENWEKAILVVPIIIEPSVVKTNPESALLFPSSINVNAPLVTSASLSKSLVLIQSFSLQR